MTSAEFAELLNQDLFDSANVVTCTAFLPPPGMTSLTFRGETKRWGSLFAAGRTWQERSDRLPDWVKKQAKETT